MSAICECIVYFTVLARFCCFLLIFYNIFSHIISNCFLLLTLSSVNLTFWNVLSIFKIDIYIFLLHYKNVYWSLLIIITTYLIHYFRLFSWFIISITKLLFLYYYVTVYFLLKFSKSFFFILNKYIHHRYQESKKKKQSSFHIVY